MGKYQAPGRLSGRVYNIKIKGDAPSPTEQARIRQYVDEQEQSFAQQYEQRFGRPLAVDDGTAFGRGWERGKASATSRLGTAVDYLGQGVGIDALRGLGQDMRAAGDTELFTESLRQPEATELEDIDGVNSFLTWAGEQAGQTAPETGATMGATIGGSLLGGPALGIGLGAATIAPTTFGGNIQRQEAEVAAGKRDKVDVGSALAATVGQSLLESISDRLLLTGLIKPGMNIFTRAVRGTAEGAVTEGLTEVGQQVLERWQAGLPLDTDDAIKEYVEAGAAGAVVGGPIRGGTALLGVGNTPAVTPPPATQTPPPAAPPAAGPTTPPSTPPAPAAPPAAGAAPAAPPAAGAAPTPAPITPPAAGPAPAPAPAPTSAAPTVAPPAAPPTWDEWQNMTPAQRLASVNAGFFPPAPPLPGTSAASTTAPPPAPSAGTTATQPTAPTPAPAPAAPPAPPVVQVPDDPDDPDWSPIDDDDVLEPTVRKAAAAPTPAPVAPPADPAPKPPTPTATSTVRPDVLARAKQVVEWSQQASVPHLQDYLEVDAATATAALDALEAAGVVSPEDMQGKRTVLAPATAKEDPAAPREQPAEGQVLDPEPQPAEDMAFDAFPPELDLTEFDNIPYEGEGAVPMMDTSPALPPPVSAPVVDETAQPEPNAQTEADANTLTPVDPATLQPTGPARIAPDAFRLGKRRKFTGKATPGWLEGPAKPKWRKAEPNDPARGEAAAAKIEDWFNKKAPAPYRKYREYITGGRGNPDGRITRADPTLHTDKEVVSNLLRTRNSAFKNAEMEAAFQFFSRFPNVVEALEEIGAVSQIGIGNHFRTNANAKSATQDKEDAAIGTARAKLIGAYDFYKGLDKATATQARAWVDRNLSPQAQMLVKTEANRIGTDAEQVIATNATLSAASEAIAKEMTPAQGVAASALGIETKENEAYRRQLAAAAVKAGRETRLAVGMPETKSKPVPLTSILKYRKGETRSDALLRHLRQTGKITKDSNDTQILDAINEFEANEKVVREFLYGKPLELPEFAVDSMALPLLPSVTAALRAGDFRIALEAVAATHPNRDVARMVGRMAEVVGSTQVRVVENLTNAAGERVPGLFDPATNTVLLDSVTGMNAHVVAHEMGHAAVSHVLADPSNTTTSEVQAVYDSVKGQLSSYYGSASLQEFAAEALTNPTFRGELARLHPNGDPLSAWSRLSHALLNFFRTLMGKPRQPMTTALSTLDDLLTAIMSPAPARRDAGALYMASTAAGVSDTMRLVNRLSQTLRSTTPGSMQSVTDQAVDFIRNDVTGVGTNLFLQTRNMPMLVEVAVKAGLTEARGLERMMNELHGATTRRTELLTGTSKVLEEIRDKADPAEYDALKDMLIRGSAAGVKASSPLGTYINDPEKHQTHQDVYAAYQRLPQPLKDVANTLWNTYSKQYAELYNAITGALASMAPGQNISPQVTSFLSRLMAQMQVADGYIPFVRDGEYWLRATMRATPNSPPETVFYTFPTEAERSRAMAAMAQMPEMERNAQGLPDFDTSLRLDPRIIRNAPDGTFVKNLLQVLDQNNVDPAVKDQFLTMVVDLLPESSFAKSLHKRQGFPGMITDPVEAFNIKAYSVARQTERLRYSREIRSAVEQLEEQWNRTRDASTHPLAEELILRARFALNPPRDALAEAITRATFNMTLGFNASSVIVQTGTIPIVVLPNLAARYKTGPAISAISAATKFFMTSGLTRVQAMSEAVGQQIDTKVRGAPSIDNWFVLDPAQGTYQVRTDMGLTPQQIAEYETLIPLLEEMAAEGELSRSLYYDSFGFEQSGRARSLWNRVTTWSGGLFHVAERMNRQVTALAAYQLHYAQAKAANPTAPDAVLRKEAAAEAVRLTRKVNGGSTLNDAPRLTQQGLGRVMGMFRNYGLHMTHMQLRYLREAAGVEVRAFKRQLASGQIPNTPAAMAQLAQLEADAKIALKATLGMWGSSLFFAGVAGVPMFNAVAMLVNATLLGDDEDDFETLVRKHIGEGMYKGWLTEATGMDVSGRIGLSGLLLRADRFNSTPSEADTFAHHFGGPAWATGVRFLRGAKELLSGGDIQRGFEQMVPAAFGSVSKSIRYATEGMTTRRGDPIVDDVSAGNVIGQALGFAPASYTMNQERNQVVKRIDTAINKKRSKIMKDIYLAERMGDYEQRMAARKALREFNAQHPTNRIELDDLKKSLRQHRKTTEEMFNGVVITPSNRAALLQNARDWDRGWQLF